MTPDINVHLVDLPPKVTEMVCPSGDGYTIYLDAHQTCEKQRASLLHALHHIYNDDWSKTDIQSIEYNAHTKAPRSLKPQGAQSGGTLEKSRWRAETPTAL